MKNSYTVHSSLDHGSPLTVHCSRLTTNDSLLTQSLVEHIGVNGTGINS